MDNNELEQNLKTLISKKLRQLRENSNETLEKTADFLDLNYSQYYRLLQGTQLPHLATLMKINQAYGLNMDWWFEDFAEIRTNKVLTK
ncbi:MAG: helix-turn-helix domain-containing protein, partial [Candidatus Margulisbacteria bacterium]|nr:helix-turn-helix domain-containing protein [Candidatus Margulisiibacteriota bacterium]